MNKLSILFLFFISLLSFSIASSISAQTPEEVLEKSDKNLSTPIVKIQRTSIGSGKLTMVSKIYTKEGKVFGRSLFPPKYVGNKFIFADGQMLYYMSRPDKLIRMPRYVWSIAWMNNVMYTEDVALVDYLSKYKSLSMKNEKKNGYDTYALEIENVSSHSYFFKRKVWIDKKSFLPIYQEIYDKDGKHLKNIKVIEIEAKGGFYYVKHSEHSLPTDPNIKVEYFIDSIKFDANINDGLFSKMSLN